MPDRQKLFLRKAAYAKFPLIGDGLNKRSIVNVEDLAKASLNVTFNNRKSQIYWITEKNLTMNQFLLLINRSASKLFENKGKKIKNKKFLRLPYGFSTFFTILDKFIQSLKFYNKYIHVFSELGQNIFASSEKYRKEFPNHHWKCINSTIIEELKEAFNDF